MRRSTSLLHTFAHHRKKWKETNSIFVFYSAIEAAILRTSVARSFVVCTGCLALILFWIFIATSTPLSFIIARTVGAHTTPSSRGLKPLPPRLGDAYSLSSSAPALYSSCEMRMLFGDEAGELWLSCA
jgi:hypothetical protein